MNQPILYTLCYVTFTGNNQSETVGAEFRYSVHDDSTLDQKRQSLCLPSPDGTWPSVEDSAEFFRWIREAKAWETAQVNIPAIGDWRSLQFQDRDRLPSSSGIYALTHGERVLYIGSSINLKARWGGSAHHLFRKTKWGRVIESQGAEMRLRHLVIGATHVSWIRFFERFLIEQQDPSMNGRASANPKSRESVSSLQEKALYAYAVAQGWCVIEGDEPPQRERSLAQAIREWNELPPATKF